MAGRSYQRLSIEEFGRHLLETADLDPIYNALWRMRRIQNGLNEQQLHRWLLAYWCFYNAGVACHMCQLDGKEYWKEMQKAAANISPTPLGTRWPRGHERRHFRGAQATQAVTELQERYPYPAQMPIYVAGEGGDFKVVAERVREHRGFGPWMAFKVADMTDRVLGKPVDFSEAAVFMFTDPTKAALMLWRERMKLPEGTRPKDKQAQVSIIHMVVEHLLAEFKTFAAPPDLKRPVNLQEVETVLCKWKSHMNGHYPLYNDIDEIRAGLMPWAEKDRLTADFLECTPRRTQ